jgi:iron complex outermembrane receptor protein
VSARKAAQRRRQIFVGSFLVAVAVTALAQQDAVPVVKLGKVEVTGSNIPRIEGESGLPVQVITREELINGGVQTMQELLERISANQSFGAFNEAKGVGNVLFGFTAASLRGLGSQRTLVLMNGRRLAPYALSGGQSVDLSGIPASAIDRIEVLHDGASAVYGTDAIGGVINFILRNDYQGAEINANYYATDEGGGNNGRVSGTAGVGDLAKDRYNFFVSADYFKQDPLKASQRERTRTTQLPALGFDGTGPFSFPANIRQSDRVTGETFGFAGVRNPTIPFPGGPAPTSCAPPYSLPMLALPYACGFDVASVTDTIPEAEKAHAVGRLTWQIDADNQFFAEGSYYWGRFTQRISPQPVASVLTNPYVPLSMSLPPTSPYYPAAFVAGLPDGDPTQPLELLYTTVELGPRVNEGSVDQWNAVFGLNGTIEGWDYQLAANYTRNQQIDRFTSGWVYASKFGELLRSGVVNPFAANTPAVLNLMRATQLTGQAGDSSATNYGADFKVVNTVCDLPSGPVALALGVEGRRESLEQNVADFSGDALGAGGTAPPLPVAHRTVGSLFGEINVPIMKSLEANVAVRYDHYSDFGGTTNPKVTLRWQPSRDVVFRGAYGTGFRAPTLSDLFQPQSLNLERGLPDPARCPYLPADPDCQDIQLHLGKVGGNPALQPEKSQQVNAGIVLAPATKLSATLDYYWVRVKNVIQIVPADTILGTDYARWTDYVVRFPPDPEHPGLPGRIAYVVQYPTNFGTITTSGIDINVQWRSPLTLAGEFAVGLNGTYVLDYKHTGLDSSLVPQSVGTRGADGAIARYRQYAQLNWTLGSWGATLANTYQSGYDEPCLGADPSGCDKRRVGSVSVWDLQGRYLGFQNTTLTLGIRNLMNAPPPISNQQNTFLKTGIDLSYADPRGRMFYGAIRYAFK